MQTETLLQTCVRAFPLLRRFLGSQLRGLQLTPIQSSAKKFSKSWWKKKIPVGVAGEKKKREELRNMRHSLQSLQMKGISCIGHLSGPSGCKDSGLGVATVWGSDALRAVWYLARWDRQAGARKSPWPRGQSELVVAAAARTRGQEGKRGWKASLLSPEGEPQGSLCCRKGKNVGVHKIQPSV